MSFIDQVDFLSIAEKHIRRLTGLEMEQARNLTKYYVIARKRLKERLLEVRHGSFTEAQLKMVLAQVETGLIQLNKQISQELILGSQISSEQATDDLVKEVNTFDKEFAGIFQPLPVDIIVESMNPDNLLINQFRSSINSYNDNLRSTIQRELTNAVIMKMPYQMVVEKVAETMALDEWKIARIVRTELHNIYNVSKVKGMEEVKRKKYPDLKKALIHPMDSRTGDDSKKLARIDPVVALDKPFKYKYRGKLRVFFTPPDRPNDRAILIPYRKAWD